MINHLKIFLIVGARPNFIKVAPLLREFRKNSDLFEAILVHTGQHYDYEMSQVFFDQLDLPEPDYFLGVGSGSHAYQTAQIMMKFNDLIDSHRPDIVLVVGDVNSTIACALTASKRGIRVAHVEAGLRSFDMSMPEEINRILTDRISDYLFVTEPIGMNNLDCEGISSDKCHLCGNVMIDEIAFNLANISKNKTMINLGLVSDSYSVITLHRPVNVDNIDSLNKIETILKKICIENHFVFPMHPRTRKNLLKFNKLDDFENIENLRIIDPLGYIDFINLVSNAKFVLTDSGGLQSETTFLSVPCLTLRETTEQPYTIDYGTNVLVKMEIESIQTAINRALSFDKSDYRTPKLWDGKASERIVKIIRESILS